MKICFISQRNTRRKLLLSITNYFFAAARFSRKPSLIAP